MGASESNMLKTTTKCICKNEDVSVIENYLKKLKEFDLNAPNYSKYVNINIYIVSFYF